MNLTSLESHLRELSDKHRRLDDDIRRRGASPSGDESLSALKREKLRLKEEMTRLEARIAEAKANGE